MGGRLVELDVSDLEPPDPLLRALEALHRLPPGKFLHMVHRMKPLLLYGQLESLGFAADTREGADGRCEIYIWRRGDRQAEQAARQAASRLPVWRE